jgi:hypothetical protein
MAVVLNSFLIQVYWTYAPVAFADNNNNNTAKLTFFEDGTGVISNGISLRVQFNYNFTEGGYLAELEVEQRQQLTDKYVTEERRRNNLGNSIRRGRRMRRSS